jgi:putative membrane protein
MMWYGWGSGGWVSWLVMALVMLVFWGGLATLVVWGVRGFGRAGSTSDPLFILQERFARGEIDQQEFESRRAVLRKS